MSSLNGRPSERGVTTLTITPDAGILNFPVLFFGGGSVFNTHTEKAPSIRAVKLTKDNVKDVAALLAKDGQTVRLTEDSINNLWRVGDWIVENYDYDDGEISYYKATAAERRKFDLR